MVSTIFKLGASMALLFSTLAVAAPAATLDAPLAKRTAGPSTIDSPNLQKILVDFHNSHRAYHQVGDLTWDDSLAQYAQDWVNKCVFKHSGGPHGENLYAIMPGPLNGWEQATADGLHAWVYEVDGYDYNNPGFGESTGHFTQYVWKDSTKVGCAWNTVDCNGQALLMCEYDPPGNVQGQYVDNVLAPKGH